MKYKLVCFDLDGTLIDNIEYSWQLFHDYFKTDKKERELTKKRFFDGEITYMEWAEHDINMWLKKGAKKQDFLDAMSHSKIRLMPGTLETLKILKKQGIKLALISGSLDIVLEYILPNYKDLFDDIFISRLSFRKDGPISKITATEYDMHGKAQALKLIAKREKLELSECVFIGDHSNDLHIAKEAGFAIAFNSKSEELNSISDITIKEKDLRNILKHLK